MRKGDATRAAGRPLRGGPWPGSRPLQTLWAMRSRAAGPRSGLQQKGHGPRLDGQALAHRAHALCRLGLDVDLVQAQAERFGNALAHGWNVRGQARRLRPHGAVDVADLDSTVVA